jgi:predicted dehydrogenase
VTIRFESGAIGNCFASWVRRKHEEVPEFQIDGEDGSLLFSFNTLRAQSQAETPLFTFDARKVQTESVEDWRCLDLELRDPFGLQSSNSWAASFVASRPCPTGRMRSPTSA